MFLCSKLYELFNVCTCVLFFAFADRLVVGPVQVALVGKGVSAGLRVGARALAAGDVGLQARFAVVAVDADLAVVAGGGVAAAVAVAGRGVAGVGVPVAFARLRMC
jgi:hypothetical protein